MQNRAAAGSLALPPGVGSSTDAPGRQNVFRDWSAEDVVRWLEASGLQQAASAFKDAGIDGAGLQRLSIIDMQMKLSLNLPLA